MLRRALSNHKMPFDRLRANGFIVWGGFYL